MEEGGGDIDGEGQSEGGGEGAGEAEGMPLVLLLEDTWVFAVVLGVLPSELLSPLSGPALAPASFVSAPLPIATAAS